MRFKLDENLDAGLTRLFEEKSLDVATVHQQGLSGAADDRVLEVSHAEGRTLITLDLDFAQPHRFPVRDTPGIVVLRVHRPLLPLIRVTLGEVIGRLASGEVRGKLWIVEPGRIREHS